MEIVESSGGALYLLWVCPPAALGHGKFPSIHEASKYVAALGDCAAKGSALLDVASDVDSDRSALIKALKKEDREGANPSLRVEAARGVAEACEALAEKIDVVRRSAASDPDRISELEASWTSSIDGAARPTTYRAKGKIAAMRFDASMARATAALARQSAATRMLAGLPLKTLHEAEEIGAAIVELKKAAGLYLLVDKDSTDLSRVLYGSKSAPAEIECASALAEICLASADRLGIAKAFALECADVKATPTSLLARLAAGVAKHEARSLDSLATTSATVSPKLIGAVCACSTGSKALADALAARDARKKDKIGDALAYAKRGVESIDAFLTAPRMNARGSGGGLIDDLEMAKKFSASTPPDLRKLLENLKAPIKTQYAAYQHDNKTIYFEAETVQLPVIAPLEMAKSIPPQLDDTISYELSVPAPPKSSSPAATTNSASPGLSTSKSAANDDDAATVVPPVGEDPPPAFSELSRSSSSAPPPPAYTEEFSPSPPPPAYTVEPLEKRGYLSCDRCTFNNTLSASECAMCGHNL